MVDLTKTLNVGFSCHLSPICIYSTNITFVSMPVSLCESNPNALFFFSPQRVPISDLAAPASPDSALSYTLTRLIGGTNYTLWMTSSTVQGDGGVQSEPLTLFLPEDGQSDTHTNTTPHTPI